VTTGRKVAAGGRQVADVEDSFRAVLVSLGLHPLLSAEKVLAHGQQNGGALSQHRLNIGHRRNRVVS
jgi:hypothetical protein